MASVVEDDFPSSSTCNKQFGRLAPGRSKVLSGVVDDVKQFLVSLALQFLVSLALQPRRLEWCLESLKMTSIVAGDVKQFLLL